ncbi:MAG: hypothetical protein GEU28_08040 [Dehalococcoidia bacterium]|nr:hypothetical protein [Dehalococcoidia bacterium]
MTRQAAPRTADMWDQWWRIGGICGLAWAILFIVAAFILQGDSPSRDDSIEEIRQYFTEDDSVYLLGDYLLAFAFGLFFLVYLVILRRVLSAIDGWPAILATVALFAGALTIIWGAIAGFFWGALALGASNPEIDDSAVRTLMEIDTYAFAGLQFPLGVFLGAAGLNILLSGTLFPRWLGIIALVAAIGALIGAAWPIDGDDEGVIASIGLIGLLGALVFVVISSVLLLIRPEPPLVVEPPGRAY